MKIDVLLDGLAYSLLSSSDKPIEQLTIDSRKVIDNSMFFAIEGLSFDGHDFIPMALKNNASAIVMDRLVDIPLGFDSHIILVEDTRKALAVIAANFYKHPENKLDILAVTGTNGKTSTTYYLESILNHAHKKTGRIGTNGVIIDGKELDFSYDTSTTPDTIEFFEILHTMAKQQVEYVVMEASSHALALDKLYNIPIKVGIFTNITQDHLNFHHTIEKYQEAKEKLFAQSDISIINNDSTNAPKFHQSAKNLVYTYGIHSEADCKGSDIDLRLTGSSFIAHWKNEAYPFTIQVPGKFSIYNALGAITACLSMDIPMEACQKGIASITGIPGRFETVENDKGIGVIVDYAHTEDSLKTILTAVRPFTKNKVIAVFGCGGDRDRSKRPLMAQTGIAYADYSILTSDNPRSEDPMDIILDMVAGLSEDDKTLYEIEPDREVAIKKAILLANENDTIVIAGKGHETTQEIKGHAYPFDDREKAFHFLQEKER